MEKLKLTGSTFVLMLMFIVMYPVTGFSTTVWSSLVDASGGCCGFEDWFIYLVTEEDVVDPFEAFAPLTLTGVYIDRVVSGTINPADLLSSSPMSLAIDQYDVYSTGADLTPSLTYFGDGGGDNPGTRTDVFFLDQLTIDSVENGWFSGTVFGITTVGTAGGELTSDHAIAPSTTTPPDKWSVSAGNTEFTAIATSTVPVPAAVWLFGSGLLGLLGLARRKTKVLS